MGKFPDRLEERIAAIRRFNRFYTRRIGVLNQAMLDSPYSLAEMRVLWELAHAGEGSTSAYIEATLGLDASYLSRILKAFKKQGLIESSMVEHDGRMRAHRLTRRGRQAFGLLDLRSSQEVRGSLEKLDERDQRRLVEAMETIERVLEGRTPQPWSAVVIRQPAPGDYGWAIERHGALYAREYGFDESFEALVAEIVARFVRGQDAKRERAWIAEVEGERMGCVFLVARSPTVAQLRLLLVDPKARGVRIGSRLVEEAVAFARQAGYRRVALWTQSILHSARRIYERAGFHRTRHEDHVSFGRHLRGETWELLLATGRET